MKKSIGEAFDEMIQNAIEITDENALNAENLKEMMLHKLEQKF